MSMQSTQFDSDDLEGALRLLAFSHVVLGSKSAGVLGDLICYARDSGGTAEASIVIAAGIGAIREMMRKEGLL